MQSSAHPLSQDKPCQACTTCSLQAMAPHYPRAAPTPSMGVTASLRRGMCAGLYLRSPDQPLSAADPPLQVANYTALQAQDYHDNNFNCSMSDRPGYCHMQGQPQARAPSQLILLRVTRTSTLCRMADDYAGYTLFSMRMSKLWAACLPAGSLQKSPVCMNPACWCAACDRDA